jgi:hypothetical protein
MAEDGRWALNIPWWQRRPRPVGNRVFNNLLLSRNPSTGAIVLWGKEGLAESDHNLVTGRFALDAIIPKETPMPKAEDDHSPEGGRAQLTLEQWRQQGYDAHSAAATCDALFVDRARGNYRLRADGPVVGLGKPLPQHRADLEGRPRGGDTQWSPGCYATSSKEES